MEVVANRRLKRAYRKHWSESEAAKILQRTDTAFDRTPIAFNFETGFGPSGLPHIGTICEVVRTALVRSALQRLTPSRTELYVVSDDLDALRRIPSDFPKQQMLKEWVGTPLCRIPDPFGKAESLSEGIHERLRQHLDNLEIEYKFIRSSDCYRSGEYNTWLLIFLRHYEALNSVIAQSVGAIRRSSYSMFMPISPFSGRVIEHLRIVDRDLQRGTITYEIPGDLIVRKPEHDYAIDAGEYYPNEPIGEPITVSVLDAHCKLQWKADWCMRMLARDICYEMHGEDLSDSARVVGRLCSVLEMCPPVLSRYGLFLDAEGRKISKSKGNGFSLSDVDRYLTHESLKLFLSRKPWRSRRFSPQLSPSINDAYLSRFRSPRTFEQLSRLGLIPRASPGEPGSHHLPVLFAKLIRILSACAPTTYEVARRFMLRYGFPRCSLDDRMLDIAWNYYQQFCLPGRMPSRNPEARTLLNRVADLLERQFESTIRSFRAVIDACVNDGHTPTRADGYRWLYLALLGVPQGPRLTTWMEIAGVDIAVHRLRTATQDRE